jgi:cell division protein FtsI (penicillin-binding protein 3)
VPGKKWVIKDRLGRIISEGQTVSAQKPGQDLILSIDRRIQYLAYRELLAGINENHAESGSVVVLDVKTGEVLAMANFPVFDPNKRISAPEAARNRALTDTFEPGSTIKAFSIASALDSGNYSPDTLIDTYPGWLRVGRNVVRDERDYGELTLAQVLQVSSNVGVTKIILSLPPDQLWDLLHRIGFGETTGIGFPGEQAGSLIKHHPWGSFVLATLGFGYGLSVTPIQLARAYAVLANEGVKLPLSLLRVNKPPKGEKVIKSTMAQQMLALLETVVTTKEGTGKKPKFPVIVLLVKQARQKKWASMVGIRKRVMYRLLSGLPLFLRRVLLLQ